MRHFALLCETSATIVPASETEVLTQVIAQYHRAILLPFLAWGESLVSSAVPDGALKEFDLARTAIRSLETAFIGMQERRGEWLALTLFDIVYASIASKHSATEGLAERAAHDKELRRWLERAQLAEFLPRIVTFDGVAGVVGLSGVRWARIPWLQQWEAGLRLARFAPEVQAQLAEVEARVRAGGLWDGEGDPAAEVEAAIALVARGEAGEDLCERLCVGRAWYTVSGDELQPRDQCGWCRVMFHSVMVRNAEPPRYGLGQHRSHACQCAEASVMNQLFLQSKEKTGGGGMKVSHVRQGGE